MTTQIKALTSALVDLSSSIARSRSAQNIAYKNLKLFKKHGLRLLNEIQAYKYNKILYS